MRAYFFMVLVCGFEPHYGLSLYHNSPRYINDFVLLALKGNQQNDQHLAQEYLDSPHLV